MIQRIIIENEEHKVKSQLTYGHLYMILTSVRGIQQQLFPVSQMSVSHINSFFKEALKISTYIDKNIFYPSRIDYLKQKFNLEDLSLSSNSFYEQIVFVILNELDKYKVVVVETTGLDNDSIGYLVKFCYNFSIHNQDKIIVLVHPEHQRVKYPEYIQLELDEAKVGDVVGWLRELDMKYRK